MPTHALKRHRRRVRALIVAVGALALLGGGLATPSSGDLQSQISASQSAAGALQSQISAESTRINATSNGIQQAGQRLTNLQDELSQRVVQLTRVQGALIAARDHLVQLENRLALATRALAANLLSRYEGNQPDLVTVIVDSHGFNDLLEQMTFMQRMASADAQIVGATRTARTAVSRQANSLGTLEVRDRELTDAVLSQRNEVAALRAALLSKQIAQERVRSQNTSKLAKLNSQLHALEAKAAAQAAAAAASGNAGVGGIAVDTHGMVQPPPGAPPAIAQVIAAGNAIATLPYIWGGGHGSFQASGYDCSGSVSYALAAAGLLSSPLDSTGFMSYGDPGPGRWITIYANASHAWMEVAGWRFDTVALAEGGTRWAQGGGEFSGFVVRHPPGL
jgi:peptidoglycan hydrolase CwlO-like protein